MVELEDEPDVPVPERHHLAVAHAVQRRVADADRAGVGVVEAAEQVQQRALAHARTPR